MILEGEIKDAKNEKSKHSLNINLHCIIAELLMSLRSL